MRTVFADKKQSKRAAWLEAYNAFRLMAFRVYYYRVYSTVKDRWLRFSLAIAASSQPIADRQAVLDWYRVSREQWQKPKAMAASVANIAAASRARLGRPTPCEFKGGLSDHEGCLVTAAARRIRPRQRAAQLASSGGEA